MKLLSIAATACLLCCLLLAGVGCGPQETVSDDSGDGDNSTTTSESTNETSPADETVGDDTSSAETAGGDEVAVAEDAKPTERVVTGDWPMWGGAPDRNMVNGTTGISLDFEAGENGEGGKNLIWSAKLGSQTYGNPVVASGIVLVGTNNGAEYRPEQKGDKGVMLAFEEKTGKFLWQFTRDKLKQGRVNDWPEQGICSTPIVEGDRIYVVSNQCELVCLDVKGFHDDENDGFAEEALKEKEDADIVWTLNMIDDLGVFPHNLATSSPVLADDLVFIVTSNGVDEAHLEVPSPRAPSFIAVNKNTGEVAWEDTTPSLDSESPEPFNTILHGQWGSPAVGKIGEQTQIYFPGGDGWLYALDAKTGEHIWKFDLNPKNSKWELGGRGTRNAIISTPVFIDNSVILAVGQDPEHGEGEGHLYRIDATKKGDVTSVLPDGTKNPNSGEIWHYGGVDADGSVTGEEGEYIFRRTISTIAANGGLVYAADLTGFIHCIDIKTGKRQWEYDSFSAIWGSPMVVDGKIMIGNEDGALIILKEGLPEGDEVEPIAEKLFTSSIYTTPTIANGVLYVSDRSRLYAFKTAAE